jgi:hypothetical protein
MSTPLLFHPSCPFFNCFSVFFFTLSVIPPLVFVVVVVVVAVAVVKGLFGSVGVIIMMIKRGVPDGMGWMAFFFFTLSLTLFPLFL